MILPGCTVVLDKLQRITKGTHVLSSVLAHLALLVSLVFDTTMVSRKQYRKHTERALFQKYTVHVL